MIAVYIIGGVLIGYGIGMVKMSTWRDVADQTRDLLDESIDLNSDLNRTNKKLMDTIEKQKEEIRYCHEQMDKHAI